MTLDDLRRLDLGITFHVDTNFPDDPSRAACYLRGMADAHRIWLHMASVGMRELSESADPEVRDLATGYPVVLEAAVWDESQYGHSVYASERDGELLETIRQILAPGGSESARTNTLRDAIHLHTAIRYAASGIVTRDSDMLRRAEAIRSMIPVYDPESAAKIVQMTRRARRITEQSRGRSR